MKTNKKFTQGYIFKVLILGAMLLILLIPLSMIRGLINERNIMAQVAEADIMEAWGSELIAKGPMLLVPGVRTTEARSVVQDTERVEIIRTPFTLVIMPQQLNIRAYFSTEMRRRGIFSVPLFLSDLALSGTFNPTLALSSIMPNEELFFNQAELLITLSNQKGIRRINKAFWTPDRDEDRREMFFHPGNRGMNIVSMATRSMGGGIFASLPDFTNSESAFDIVISMQGGGWYASSQ